MKRLLFLLCLSVPAYAADTTISGRDANGQAQGYSVTNGQMTTTLGECEDDTNNLCRVEHYYTGCVDKTADASCKASAGFVHTISCAGTDAAATAGDVALRDATSAGTGTIVKQIGFAAAYLQPFTLTLDQAFSTGIYLDFTTTADVACNVSYR